MSWESLLATQCVGIFNKPCPYNAKRQIVNTPLCLQCFTDRRLRVNKLGELKTTSCRKCHTTKENQAALLCNSCQNAKDRKNAAKLANT